VSYKLSTATHLAPAGKVNLALSLIGCLEEVSIAMTFVFGDMLTCVDVDTAKLVAFSKQVGGVRSVMFDGDVYDPSRMLLVRVRALRAAEGRVVQTQAALRKAERVFGVLREGGEPRNRWGC
jgi:structural maintenance of chromosome 2